LDWQAGIFQNLAKGGFWEGSSSRFQYGFWSAEVLAGVGRRFLVRGGSHRAKEIKCYWAAYASISASGLSCTWKMLPILLFMIFYKKGWLTLVV